MVAPEADLLRGKPADGERIVQVDDLAALETRADSGEPLQRRHDLERHADRAVRHEPVVGAGGCRHEQRDAVHAERVGEPLHQSLGQAVEVEVGVQVARKREQCAAVIVTVAVVRVVERRLDCVLDDRRQQHDEQRGQDGDDRVVLLRPAEEHLARQAQRDRVDGRDGRQHRRVDDGALDDHLDVHQPVADDGGGEGERHEGQQHDQNAQRLPGVIPEGVRESVQQGERQRACQRAPHDPAELPARGDRPQATERARHGRLADDERRNQLQHLDPVQSHDPVLEGIARERPGREYGDARQPQQNRRQIEQGHQPAALRRLGPAVLTLGEDEGEVHEQRRQRQHRHDVAPVEHPVQAIQPAAVGEATDAEKRDGQPEEVQGRRIARALHTHRAADEQREDGDRREGVVEEALPVGQGRQIEPQRSLVPRPGDDVREWAAPLAAVLGVQDLLDSVDPAAVDGDQDVAGLDAGPCPCRLWPHMGGHHALGARLPQHPVLDLDPGEPDRDVGDNEDEQNRRHGDRERGTAPLRATGPLCGAWPESLGHRVVQSTTSQAGEPNQRSYRSRGSKGCSTTRRAPRQ